MIHRPFEKTDSQNHDYALSKGSFEVTGLVTEDEQHFLCKYKVYPNEDIEIFTPNDEILEECENEIGKIFKKKMVLYYINFKKILTETNKELESVHSGNVNKIQNWKTSIFNYV